MEESKTFGREITMKKDLEFIFKNKKLIKVEFSVKLFTAIVKLINCTKKLLEENEKLRKRLEDIEYDGRPW